MPKDSSPGPGHNIDIGVPQEVFLSHLAKHNALMEVEQNAKAARKKFRKQMKADGIRLKEFDTLVMFNDMNRDDVKDHFEHLHAYMVFARHPIGHQFEMLIDPTGSDGFSEKGDEIPIEQAMENATQAGFWAGLHDKPMSESPHDDNTEIGQAWIKAWHDGQDMKPSTEPMSADDDADND